MRSILVENLTVPGFAPLRRPSVRFSERRRRPAAAVAAAAALCLDRWPPCGKHFDRNGTFWAEVAADTPWRDGQLLHSCSI